MCGRINVTDDPFVKRLAEALGIKGLIPKTSEDIAPGSPLSIVRNVDDKPVLHDAVWWLCLDSHSLKPNYRYASFNSRSDKLNNPSSIAHEPFRESRCIIPASGFVEGVGDKKHYYHIQAESGAIAFGGLYKEWLNQDTGELVYSASIITLPPHEKLSDIHPKSMPLMLPYDNGALIEQWLDKRFRDTASFNSFLKPAIRENLIVTPIDRPSKRNTVGPSIRVYADQVA